MPVIVSPWQVVKRQLETEGALNRQYDPNLTGKVSRIDTSAVKMARMEKFTVTPNSLGQASVTLSATPDPNEPIVAVSDRYHVEINSVSGSVVNMTFFSHSHRHKWLTTFSLAGLNQTGSYLYYNIYDGQGNVVTHADGTPLNVAVRNFDTADNTGSAYTDGQGLTLRANNTTNVWVFYVPEV